MWNLDGRCVKKGEYMKKVKLLISIIALAILLSSCAFVQEDSPSALPAFTAPHPSVTPYTVLDPSSTPEPGMRQKLCSSFNHMVREELDARDRSLLEDIPKQEAYVKVYAAEEKTYYNAFVEFEDRILRISIQNDLQGYFAYRNIWLYEEEMPGDTYEYILRNHMSAKQAELLDEFTYAFDPDCEFTYKNKYFYIWEEMRDQVIEELKSDSMTSGEYTFLFCDYDELYFPDPEEAGLVVVEIRDGGESYYCYTINRECITYRKPLFDMSEKEMEYYKAREFDRETVYVE